MTKVQIFDGAMGTMLQQRGLAPGQSPEELNITNPEIVESVHLDYLRAGADILITNTFGKVSFPITTHITKMPASVRDSDSIYFGFFIS